MHKNIEFKSGKETLRGSLFIPKGKGPFPGVIFFHGNGGKGEKYFEAGKKFSEKGLASLAFNFRGCGLSDGNYLIQTHKDAFEDALEAINFLTRQESVEKKRIGVVGGSFGGYISAMILSKIKIKSLVLLSPSSHDDPLSAKLDMGPLEKEVEYFADKANWENSKSYENIARYSGPLLIIKSENDENVPGEVINKYFEEAVNASIKQIKTIKGADHRLSTPEMRDRTFEIIINWFMRTL